MPEYRPMMSFCPFCGFVNAPQVRACINCGAHLRGGGPGAETAWEQFVAMLRSSLMTGARADARRGAPGRFRRTR